MRDFLIAMMAGGMIGLSVAQWINMIKRTELEDRITALEQAQ